MFCNCILKKGGKGRETEIYPERIVAVVTLFLHPGCVIGTDNFTKRKTNSFARLNYLVLSDKTRKYFPRFCVEQQT